MKDLHMQLTNTHEKHSYFYTIIYKKRANISEHNELEPRVECSGHDMCELYPSMQLSVTSETGKFIS